MVSQCMVSQCVCVTVYQCVSHSVTEQEKITLRAEMTKSENASTVEAKYRDT